MKVNAKSVRCAVYTRKSSESGLEQDFNSLEAPRDRCESYIDSQANRGWEALPTRYDDGGFSGGTLERPALQRLLGDARRGRLDCVVIYRIDRLSRSLLDSLNIVGELNDLDVEVVSSML